MGFVLHFQLADRQPEAGVYHRLEPLASLGCRASSHCRALPPQDALKLQQAAMYGLSCKHDTSKKIDGHTDCWIHLTVNWDSCNSMQLSSAIYTAYIEVSMNVCRHVLPCHRHQSGSCSCHSPRLWQVSLVGHLQVKKVMYQQAESYDVY